MEAILETRNLTKRFGAFPALSDVNICIGSGRIVGLLGANGSGKTTLIKLANGLLTPTEGEILIGGVKPGTQTKRIVSYLPDRTYFDNWMKVKDCLKLFADFYEDFNIAKAGDMLLALGIDADKPFRSLSKGTKEKVQLVLVMSRSAHLYLLDEPIGGVDPAARDYILNTIIRNYNEEGTVIISTHLIADIEKVLDDVIFLMNGRVERVSSVDAIRAASGKSVDEVFREVIRCEVKF
ncbi:MAG: ABC transporter ATP-binding protein [Clostridiales Family XIII bacterium]|jgi:ABC-2 type transport system ATP-binding protein|nr:ABC transporter ATP-binding protein [Clostridiales Family XIII bacterium]